MIKVEIVSIRIVLYIWNAMRIKRNPSKIIRYDIEDITTLFKCERECEKHDKKILSLQYDNNVKAEIISTMKEFWRQTVNINDISESNK